MLSRLFRHISHGFKYFSANKVMSFAAVGVLVACLFIVGTLFLVTVNLNENIKNVEEKNEIVIFIDDAAAEEDIDNIYSRLSAIENVKSFRYVTKEQALTEYMVLFESESALFRDLIENNPLPQYFSITIKELELFDETVYQLSEIPLVYKIRSQEQVVDTILSVGTAVRRACVWVLLLMACAAFFIIVNTIRLASFYFRKHINIMKYVGATNWYIRWPFIVEGAIIGLLAAFFAYLIQWYLYVNVFETMALEIGFLTVIPFDALAASIMNLFAASGMFLGIVGSGVSISKYLKV